MLEEVLALFRPNGPFVSIDGLRILTLGFGEVLYCHRPGVRLSFVICRLLLLSKSELETCSFGLNALRTVGSVVVALVVVEYLGFEVVEFLCLFFL